MKKNFLFFIIFLFLTFRFSLAYDLLITEMMYNPEGDDKSKEWIEVLNNSNKTFHILSGKNGWKINDGKNHVFKEEIILNPNEILVIAQNKENFLKTFTFFNGKVIEANFLLRNKGGEVSIFDNNKNLITSISYFTSCGGNGNGFSIAFENGNCFENKIKGGSPGNLLVKKYEDLNKEDKEEKSFKKEIESTSSLILKNSSNFEDKIEETKNYQITDKQSEPTNQNVSLNQSFQTSSLKELKTTLLISEFLPNPEGNDYGQEFIEIYNYGNEAIDLKNFYLIVGSKKVKLEGVIEPMEYFVLYNKNYNFYIKNKGDSISLYFENEKIFEISYNGQAPVGQSFSRKSNGEWEFTTTITPGKENIFSAKTSYDKPNKQKNNLNDQFIRNSSLEANLNKDINFLNNKNKFDGNIEANKNDFLYLIGGVFLIVILSLLVWMRL